MKVTVISLVVIVSMAILTLAPVGDAAAAASCKPWVMYKQCDSRWGSAQLGTSPTQTICSAGCAMSSVAMSIATYGENIYGNLADPGSLNKWLTTNHGYASGDLIVWAAIDALGGPVFFNSSVTTLSTSQLGQLVGNCQPVIANVRNGTHWVLVTGATSDPNVWSVNDPGFSQTTYQYSTMLRFIVYSIGANRNTDTKVVLNSNDTPNHPHRPISEDHQPEPSLLFRAIRVGGDGDRV